VPEQTRPLQLAQAGGPTPAPGASPPPFLGEGSGVGAVRHEAYHLGDIPDPGVLAGNAVLVALLMVVFGLAATGWFRRRMADIPRGVQSFGEYIVEQMINFTRGVIGPGGEKYVPLVGTLFFFILIGNLFGLVPYLNSPTSNLSTTLALGLIVFFYVQFVGIRSNGVLGYLKHFWGPFTDIRNPMTLIGLLMFPIEVISEVVKPFTLAMRLFGNIFGEDTVIIVLATLAVTLLPAPLKGVIPFQFPILLLGLLTAFVQTLVFTLLTCIYISLLSHHEEGHGHAPEHGPAEAGLASQ
jgi:F-type H+-transporting ATPase subunit a